MSLTGIIVTPGEEKLIADFYTRPASDASIQFYLNREPSFFDALQAEGDDPLVYAVIDNSNGQIAGSYIRLIRECFINGKAEKAAYISSMKIHPKYQGGWVFARMLKSMQQLEEADSRLHYFSVMADNPQAGNLFLSGRPTVPMVKQVGDFTTRVFKPFKKKTNPSLGILTALQIGVEEVTNFLNQEGARKQLFPVYRNKHFEDTSVGLLRGLSMDDILVAVKDGEIVGTLAVWNQSAYRRWMLYRSQSFRIIQPLVNIYSLVTGMPAIPIGNKAVSCRYLAMICIKDDDPVVFENLLYHAMNREIALRSKALFVLGNFDHDPMVAGLRFPSLKLKSKIVCFAWQQHESFLTSIPFNQTYIETGAL